MCIRDRSSKWHWKSRDIGGVSALRFLIEVDGMKFTDAVKLLCEESPSFIPTQAVEREKLQLQYLSGNLNGSFSLSTDCVGIKDGLSSHSSFTASVNFIPSTSIRNRSADTPPISLDFQCHLLDSSLILKLSWSVNCHSFLVLVFCNRCALSLIHIFS